MSKSFRFIRRKRTEDLLSLLFFFSFLLLFSSLAALILQRSKINQRSKVNQRSKINFLTSIHTDHPPPSVAQRHEHFWRNRSVDERSKINYADLKRFSLRTPPKWRCLSTLPCFLNFHEFLRKCTRVVKHNQDRWTATVSKIISLAHARIHLCTLLPENNKLQLKFKDQLLTGTRRDSSWWALASIHDPRPTCDVAWNYLWSLIFDLRSQVVNSLHLFVLGLGVCTGRAGLLLPLRLWRLEYDRWRGGANRSIPPSSHSSSCSSLRDSAGRIAAIGGYCKIR